MLRLLLFFLLNFGALAIGGYLMGNPIDNVWYQSVNKAPWTPPGWVFGAAWTSIMVCFSFFMWKFPEKAVSVNLNLFYALFALQWVLNVAWSPVFFRYHHVFPGLFIISALTLLVGYFLYIGFAKGGWTGILMLPYFVWLLIATSLNAYILLKN